MLICGSSVVLQANTSTKSCRRFQRAFVVIDKLLDAFVGEFMSQIKRLPGSIQIQFFVWDRPEGFALPVYGLVSEIFVRQWKPCLRPLFEKLGGRGGQFRAQLE